MSKEKKEQFEARAQDIENQVIDQALRGIDPDSQEWRDVHEACIEACIEAWEEGITDAQWFDAAHALVGAFKQKLRGIDPDCEHCDGEGTEIHIGPQGYYDGPCTHCWKHDGAQS